MNNNNKVITTAASNIFFPFLLNFIWSIHKNYKNHPKIIIYDLWLNYFLKKFLLQIKWVDIVKVPKFTSYWNSCYSWKIWIFNQNINNLHLHIDCWSTILWSLDPIYEKIENNWYFLVTQKQLLKYIIPIEYYKIFDISNSIDNYESFAAWIIWLNKKNNVILNIIDIAYNSMLSWLCLWFSKSEIWKNRWKNKSVFIRNCKLFRHDQTILNILFYKFINSLNIEDINKYAYIWKDKPPNYCLIHNHRINFKEIKFVNEIIYSNKNIYFYIWILINKIFVYYKKISILVLKLILKIIKPWNYQ